MPGTGAEQYVLMSCSYQKVPARWLRLLKVDRCSRETIEPKAEPNAERQAGAMPNDLAMWDRPVAIE